MPKKLLLVILSAILMPVVASAQSFLVDYFPVLVYGDTDIYKQVFNGVAIMFNNKTIVGFVTNVVGILAFIMIVWRLIFKHDSAGRGETGSAPWEMFFKQFAFLCLVMFVFLNPAFKSTVTIKDQRAFFGQQAAIGGATIIKVDNVPTVLAFVASGTSYLGYALVNLVDTAFANSRLNGTRYSDVGFMTNFRFISRNNGTGLGEGDSKDPQIRAEKKIVSDLRNFVEKCAIPYQTLTGDTFDALDFGFITLTDLNPQTWLSYDNVKFLEAAPGVGCKDFYASIMNEFNAISTNYERRSIEAMGMNPGTARNALTAMAQSVLAAPDNVAGPASRMNGYTQYHLRASLDGIVAAARYADSFGVTGANAEAMNQSMLSASAKMTDVTSQARFLFSAQTLPKALHIIIAILYAIFPFMLVVVAIRGYPEGLKVLYYFAGGMLSMELIKMSLALVHNLVSYITSVDGATLLHAATLHANNVDYNKVIHGHKYYQYMAEQATLAADIGTAAMFMIPMVVATGQVKLLGSALGGAVSAHAPNQGIQGSQAEIAKANDAENRGMDSVVAGYSTAAVMKGIEENNAAIASLSKMDNYNDFNKGQVGQQMQQIGSTAGYGSELNSEKDFQNVLSGGKFQGVQSVSNMKSLGQEFESDQNFKYAADTNGRALARTLGNDATAKTIGSARGLIAGDFFDKDGNLKDNREGNLYTQGLENQARISANQTAGIGKLGEFTRAEMNAIQYGAEAGALGQIAQGNSLRRVFGTGAGFQESYSAMANTQADMQNIQAKETARSAREHFKGIGTSSAEGSAYSRVSRLQADQRFEEMQGSTDAYETARSVNSNIAREQANLSATSNFKSTQAKLDNINPFDHKDAIDKLSSATANEAGEKAFQSSVGFEEKVKQGAAYKDGTLKTSGAYGSGLEAQTRFDTGQTIANMKNAPANIQKSIDEQHKNTQAEHSENYKENANDFYKRGLTADNMAYGIGVELKNLGGVAKMLTGDYDGARKIFNAQIRQDKAENQRLEAALSQSTDALNAAKSGDFGSAGALTGAQNYTLGTAGTTGTFNASGGFVQGGTQSGVSLSHNTQHSYSSGITASGGSLFAASATQMGFSADGFAAGASALSAVTQTAAFMAGPVGRGSMAAASALSSAASSGASATISRLNTMDRASRDFAHNQLASIGHIGMEGDMMRFSSALSQGRVLAQERSQGANGLMKRNKQGGLVISANKASGMGKAF